MHFAASKKHILQLFITLSLTLSLTLTLAAASGAAQEQKYSTFTPTEAKQLEVTISKLNVRSGPGMEYKRIGSVSKGTILNVLGVLGEWYVVHLPDDSIEVVSADHVQPIEALEASTAIRSSDMPPDAEVMINVINSSRIESKLSPLIMDPSLMQAAQAKAMDMSVHQYFSHNSPTYGSPFEMLRRFSVVFKAAAENIAGSRSILSAQDSIMESPSHRANILNSRFKKIGVGVHDNPTYGKIIVQLFIE